MEEATTAIQISEMYHFYVAVKKIYLIPDDEKKDKYRNSISLSISIDCQVYCNNTVYCMFMILPDYTKEPYYEGKQSPIQRACRIQRGIPLSVQRYPLLGRVVCGAGEEQRFSGSMSGMPLLGPVWLGSGSASRLQLMQEILDDTTVPYVIEFAGKVSADIDEKAIRYEDPKELVLALAHAKADAILEKHAGAMDRGFLITCDQVVLHKGNILEKPEDEKEARAMIAGYAEAPASTVGSTVVTNLGTGQRVEHVDVATITFAETGIPGDAVDFLVEEGEIFWCAGGLMVEHPKVQPWIVSMEGGMDAIMGLKKQTVVDLLGDCYSK